MKKAECKQLTIKDLEELYNKHITANSDEQKELWKNTEEFNKLALNVLRESKCTNYKIITNNLIVDDIWAKDVDNLNYAFKVYDIKEFVFKDTSTEAMKILIRFLELGWHVEGTQDWGLEERYEFKDGNNKRYYEPLTGILLKK